ncbi:MAG: glycosyltransferase family 2 protein [Vicinamibacterales bacterium]
MNPQAGRISPPEGGRHIGRPPVVSVLLPVRNGMPYLPIAIESLLVQSFGDFEIIAINDGSTDGTAAYLAGLRDPRVRAISPGGVGLATALNTGLAEARGRYIARQDADDWSMPERFARQVACLDANPGVALVATCAGFVDGSGHPVDNAWTRTVRSQQDPAQTADEILAMMPLTCCITHGSVMMRAGVLRAAGGYDQAMVPAEDYDLWLRLLPGHQLVKLPDRLYAYRVHDEQSSTARRRDQMARVIEAKLRYVRRRVPNLPRPVRLVLPCNDRGAELFRSVGPSEGYDPAIRATAASRTADVVAVTDFSKIPHYAIALAAAAECRQFGNLFVRNQP